MANEESDVGYRVRLWALVISSMCTSRDDRVLIYRFTDALPLIDAREVQPVSLLILFSRDPITANLFLYRSI